MRRSLAVLLGAGLVLAPAGVVWAQNPQPAPPGNTAHPVAPPSAPTPPPEKVAPGALNTHSGKTTLSDKLADQNGTLKPPAAVDPGMTIKKPAETGSMPVIHPPTTKDDGTKVQPK